MKCYQCGKVKRCQMYQVRAEPDTPGAVKGWLARAVEYLCRPCARELGYTEPARSAIRSNHLMACPANDADVPEDRCECTP